MPKPSSPPQPKRPPSRVWLFAPYVAVALAAAVWSGFWLAERARLLRAFDGAKASAAARGITFSWSVITIDGWPFRLHLAMGAPHIGGGAGWAIDAPGLDAEAMAYAPDHWMIAAPLGLTVTRPGKGALIVSGQAIRASIGALGSPQPRYSFEGDSVVFAPVAGAQPAAIESADRLELHLQPGPGDQAALLIRLDGAALRPDAPLAALADGKPVSMRWDARLSHLSSFKGSGWPAMLQAWTAAGGGATVVDGRILVGGVNLIGQGGPLTADADGRLSGELALKLDPAQAAAKPALNGLDLRGAVPLSFKNGRAAIGPIPMGAALKIG